MPGKKKQVSPADGNKKKKSQAAADKSGNDIGPLFFLKWPRADAVLFNPKVAGAIKLITEQLGELIVQARDSEEFASFWSEDQLPFYILAGSETTGELLGAYRLERVFEELTSFCQQIQNIGLHEKHFIDTPIIRQFRAVSDGAEWDQSRADILSLSLMTAWGKFVERVTEKFDEAMTELMEEVKLLTLLELEGGYLQLMHEKDDLLKALAEKHKKEWLRKMGARGRGGRTASRNLSYLLGFYELLYPVWKEAAEIYRDNKKRDWRKVISASYAGLPTDLIELFDPKPKLPEEALSGIREKVDKSRPGPLACEHAARLCGASAFQYPTSYLKNLLSRQRAMIEALKKEKE